MVGTQLPAPWRMWRDRSPRQPPGAVGSSVQATCSPHGPPPPAATTGLRHPASAAALGLPASLVTPCSLGEVAQPQPPEGAETCCLAFLETLNTEVVTPSPKVPDARCPSVKSPTSHQRPALPSRGPCCAPCSPGLPARRAQGLWGLTELPASWLPGLLLPVPPEGAERRPWLVLRAETRKGYSWKASWGRGIWLVP